MSSSANETSPTTEPTSSSSKRTPSQAYQRNWQREYRQWKAAMKAAGTPVTGRAVPRVSRSELSYSIKTRYTKENHA